MELQRNRPVAKLLRWFADKKSGRVCEARKELRLRFDYLDWAWQKKIATAMLASCKTDRQWMYTKMLDWWDDSFFSAVAEDWEKNHEDQCAWVVARNLPKAYVMQQLRHFSGLAYFWICRRFAADGDFAIDDSRLDVWQQFNIHALAAKPLDGAYCIDAVFRSIADDCRNENFRVAIEPPRGKAVSILNFSFVYGRVKDMEQMGLHTYTAQLADFDQIVRSEILSSMEWRQMNSANLSDSDYNRQRVAIARQYIVRRLDPKYVDKATILHKMIETNPNIATLVDKLDLQPVAD